jgi:peptide/nickel transport system ATP-binding protein
MNAPQTDRGAAAPLLEVDDLTVDFQTRAGPVHAVRGVSFSLAEGEILGIVGESGSGKSVTCRAILGLLPRTARIGGSIRFGGQELTGYSLAQWQRVRGRQGAMIFQNPASHLDPLMRIGAQISESLRHHLGMRPPQARQEAVHLLSSVGIAQPELRVHSYPHELSGGMKQRALIAGAIACHPRLLLADEPTTALDVTVQARILELLRQLNRQHRLAIVLISHDLGVVAEICQRVLVMRNGELVEQAGTRNLIEAPRHPYTQLLIASQPGLRPHAIRAAKPMDGARPLVQVETLSVSFRAPFRWTDLAKGRLRAPRIPAVDGASFEVRPSETLGVVGESGSGKSTVARAIARLLSPNAGRVLFEGAEVHGLEGAELLKFRRSVQMVFQSPYDSLNPRLTVRQTLSEPLRRHRLVPRRAVADRVRELAAMVELPETLLDRTPRQLSGGQCQRVGIARALAMQPRLLIADEVTSSLDVTTQAQILSLLERLREEAGLTMIYISHDLAVVRALCDRVLVFRSGRIVESGPVEQVLAHPANSYTQALLAAVPRLALPRSAEERASLQSGEGATHAPG